MTPERFLSPCVMCGDTLDIRKPGVFQLTVGWVKNRSQGGGNAIALPERREHWACGSCIESRIHGPKTPSLF